MPPAKSGLFGPCTIWDLDEDTPDGGNFQQLTSRPYPVEAVESFIVSAEDSIVDYGTVDTFFVDIDAHLAGGQLREPLSQYEMLPENFNTFMDLDHGELRTLLIQYEMQSEAFSNAMDITDGALNTVLIRYQDWPAEPFTASMNLTGGSLS